MVAGEPYDPADPELVAERERCRAVLRRFDAASTEAEGMEILRGLLGGVGDGAVVVGPLRCDYGWNVTLGDRAFLNCDVVILDCAPGDGRRRRAHRPAGAADRRRPPARSPRARRRHRVRGAGEHRAERLDRRRSDRPSRGSPSGATASSEPGASSPATCRRRRRGREPVPDPARALSRSAGVASNDAPPPSTRSPPCPSIRSTPRSS